jgi:hypothetical protein
MSSDTDSDGGSSAHEDPEWEAYLRSLGGIPPEVFGVGASRPGTSGSVSSGTNLQLVDALLEVGSSRSASASGDSVLDADAIKREMDAVLRGDTGLPSSSSSSGSSSEGDSPAPERRWPTLAPVSEGSRANSERLPGSDGRRPASRQTTGKVSFASDRRSRNRGSSDEDSAGEQGLRELLERADSGSEDGFGDVVDWGSSGTDDDILDEYDEGDMLLAEGHDRNRVLRKVLCGWQGLLVARQETAECMAKAAEFNDRRLVLNAMTVWKRALQLRKREMMRPVWVVWRTAIFERRRAKLREHEATHRYRRKMLGLCFSVWRMEVAERRAINARKTLAVHHWALVTMLRAWRAWFAWHREQQGKRAQRKLARLLFRQRLLSKGVVMWFEASHEEQNRREERALAETLERARRKHLAVRGAANKLIAGSAMATLRSASEARTAVTFRPEDLTGTARLPVERGRRRREADRRDTGIPPTGDDDSFRQSAAASGFIPSETATREPRRQPRRRPRTMDNKALNATAPPLQSDQKEDARGAVVGSATVAAARVDDEDTGHMAASTEARSSSTATDADHLERELLLTVRLIGECKSNLERFRKDYAELSLQPEHEHDDARLTRQDAMLRCVDAARDEGQRKKVLLQSLAELRELAKQLE